MLPFKYRPTLRPAGAFTLPRNLAWDYVEVPADYVNRPDLPTSRHRYGVIAVERKLTTDECSDFALVEV